MDLNENFVANNLNNDDDDDGGGKVAPRREPVEFSGSQSTNNNGRELTNVNFSTNTEEYWNQIWDEMESNDKMTEVNISIPGSSTSENLSPLLSSSSEAYHHQNPYTVCQLESGPENELEESFNDYLKSEPLSHQQVSFPPSHHYGSCSSIGEAPINKRRRISSDHHHHHQKPKTLQFFPFEQEKWSWMCDENCKELRLLNMKITADKGFEYSEFNSAFIAMKKNHIQISVEIEASETPKFVFNEKLTAFWGFKLAFCGLKSEDLSRKIAVMQSDTARKRKVAIPPFFNVLKGRNVVQTVKRLHFADATDNNSRKDGLPNPNQKFFNFIVSLYAVINDKEEVLIQSYASENVIVRGTKLKDIENDEPKKKDALTIFEGPVAIGTDKPLGMLNVNGDMFITGNCTSLSDGRFKEILVERCKLKALDNLMKLRIVDFRFKPEIALKYGLTVDQIRQTGVIAQELQQILPDAVSDTGEFLTVDESRIFFEAVLALQGLFYRIMGFESRMEKKIDKAVGIIFDQRKQNIQDQKGSEPNFALNLDTALDRTFEAYFNGTIELESRVFSKFEEIEQLLEELKHRQKQRKLQKVFLLNWQDSRNERRRQNYKRQTNISIMILSAILSVCLLTAVGLYVLDWHSRNYSYHYQFEWSKPANLVISPLQYMPTYQPDAPPIQSHCISPSCRAYCCAAEAPQPPIDSSSTDDVSLLVTQSTSNGGISNFNITSGIGRAPQSSSVLFGTGVKISLPMLNATLDQRYCVEKSCNKRKGIFNLYIPVSKHLPDAPIEIEFAVPHNKIINNCGHMPDFNHKTCPSSRQSVTQFPTSLQILENTFELSVGSYLQSAYRFRVAHTTEACYASQERISGSFEEYNLIFYRVCSGK